MKTKTSVFVLKDTVWHLIPFKDLKPGDVVRFLDAAKSYNFNEVQKYRCKSVPFYETSDDEFLFIDMEKVD